jgi:hypothetical protein
MNKQIDIHKICFASNEEKTYKVFPIYSDEKLVTLRMENEEKFRIPISDLFEFYTLFDFNKQIIYIPN